MHPGLADYFRRAGLSGAGRSGGMAHAPPSVAARAPDDLCGGDLDRGGRDRAAAGRESTGRSAGSACRGTEQIVLSVFQSISARTAGFSVMANMQQLTAGQPGAVDRADVHRHGARFDGRRHHDRHTHRAVAGDVELCAPVGLGAGEQADGSRRMPCGGPRPCCWWRCWWWWARHG